MQDFDEWFDRGTHGDTKDSVRMKLLSGPPIRTFRSSLRDDGSIRIDGTLVIVRAVKP